MSNNKKQNSAPVKVLSIILSILMVATLAVSTALFIVFAVKQDQAKKENKSAVTVAVDTPTYYY
jgi:flagellar basal body-associated protein FliL